MFNADDKHGQSGVIFAWFPVITKDKKIVWLSSVERIWNSYKHYSILMADDPGEYVGGWEYHSLAKENNNANS